MYTMRISFYTLVLMALFVVMTTGLIYAQEKDTTAPDMEVRPAPALQPTRIPLPPRAAPDKQQPEMMQQRPGMQSQSERMKMMMERMGVTPDMTEQGKKAMKVNFYMNGPGALIGRADELGLSDGQKNDLMNIMQQARENAMKVLTLEQKGKVGVVSDEMMSMDSVCQKIMKAIDEKAGRKDAGKMMMGPMMMSMMDDGEETETQQPEQPAETAPKDPSQPKEIIKEPKK